MKQKWNKKIAIKMIRVRIKYDYAHHLSALPNSNRIRHYFHFLQNQHLS